MQLTQLQQAQLYLYQQQYQQATQIFEQCIHSNPELITNYLYLGLAKLLQQEPDAAQLIWLSAMAKVDDSAIDSLIADLITILQTTANQYLDNHNFQLAQIIYEQILEFDGDQPEILYHLGQTVAQQGDYDQAIIYWRQATKIKPDFLEVYQEQAQVYQKLLDYQEAINCYSKAVEINPNHVDTFYNLGICLIAVNQLDNAITCFHNCLKLQPNYAPALGDLAYILLQQSKLDQAIYYLQSFVNNQEKFINNYHQWSKNLIQNNKANQHIQIFFQLIEALENPNNTAKIYLVLSNLFLINRQYQQANQCYQQAILLDSTLQNNINTCIAQIPEFQQPNNINIQDNTIKKPQGFYETALNWAEIHNLDKTNYCQIYNSTIIQLQPPQTLGKQIHFSFRFGHQIQLPSSFVALIPEGRYWLNAEQSSSAIMTPDHQILGDLSPEFPSFSPGHPDQHPSKHSIFQREFLTPIEQKYETVAILSGLLNNVYFHWMLEVLPKIQLLNLSQLDLGQIDQFIVHNQLPFQKETLQLLGIDENKIVQPSLNQPFHIQAKQLIVPSLPGTLAWMPSWTCDFLKHNFLKQELINKYHSFERIYISRQNSSNRRIINEDEVIDFLSQFGFQTVNFESMSVLEQAALMANAKIVVAGHGSGLTNLIFCHQGTKVIEILSPNYVYHCYWLLSCVLNLDYYYILGTIPEGDYLHRLFAPDARQEDIWLNIEDLKLAQTWLLENP